MSGVKLRELMVKAALQERESTHYGTFLVKRIHYNPHSLMIDD